MPFKNRIRLPFYISRPQFPMERNVFRRADGSSKVLSMVVRNTFQGFTDHLPQQWHKKLVIALAHDNITIEGDNYLGDVVLDGDYQIEWQEFLDNPVAAATFQIQVTPFDATNSNCVSCETVTQLSVEDDTVPGLFGDDDGGSINVFDNDSICCYPATSQLIYFNTDFLNSAMLVENGTFSFETLPATPSQTNVKIATYRVTCPDGSYDDADVYASFDGSGGETCCQPSNVSVNEELSVITWEAGCEPANGFYYDFRKVSDPGVPVFSNTVTGEVRTADVPLIVTNNPAEYIFTIYSRCESVDSATTTFNFTIPPPVGNCTTYQALYEAEDGPYNASISYMNCTGSIITNIIPRLTPTPFCVAVDDANLPIYMVSNRPATSFTPAGPCGAACYIYQNNSGDNAEGITYNECDGTPVENVTITPGSNFCAQAGAVWGEGIGLLTIMGPC